MRRGQLARKERKDRADQLKADRENRSPQQQLDLLDERLGKDTGATKERKRLHQLLNSPPATTSGKVATTKSQRRKEKAKKHAMRRENGN